MLYLACMVEGFGKYVTLPLRPPHVTSTLLTISLMAGDQLVVLIGVTHISLPLHQIQSKEQERKRTNTNNMLGVNSKCKTRSCATLCIPNSIYRLTLAWVTSENFTKQLECRPILTLSSSLSLDPISCSLASLLRCRLPLSVSRHQLLQLLCPTYSLLASTSGPAEISSSKPFVCLAGHLHSVTNIYMPNIVWTIQTFMFWMLACFYQKHLIKNAK